MTTGHEAGLAGHYDSTRDTAGFTDEVPIEARRQVTISVRFSEEEIAALRNRAEELGIKVTAFIRAAALDAERPLDRAALARLAAGVEEQAHRLRTSLR
ncbi:plasmid mobilization protein [Sediminivirga luteola]|uniref:Ribbon-helix-helix CopG family protein n=1 Tax=Sediminivirga luteola TaxID=1774748 RepID=A0A8J2TV30_9MICO|nr:hypothetical protein [Sediminivirga luteola]MCI2264724.1 hypothetical protein [Sediminivirga luteola]GGA02210.1 hypothetical protein GCM10011333_00920 [Sediminivirga luteola]